MSNDHFKHTKEGNKIMTNIMSSSKILLLFRTMPCAIIIIVISFYLPCHAEEPAISNHPIAEEVSKPTATNDEENMSAIDKRLEEENKTHGSSFSISPHRQFYILLASYDPEPNTDVYDFTHEKKPMEVEAKYQLSFKVQLWENVFKNDGDLFAAYTQRSFWQVYDDILSSPFRETNYEPELFMKFDTDFNALGFNLRAFVIGINHQSNGRSGARSLSRSWNRIYTDFILQRGSLAVGLKTWYRIPEKKENDDNSDITDYLGNGELFGAYKIKQHVFSFMFRNNLRLNGNKGAAELGWSYPISKNLKVYVQYFVGYGESLVDYNYESNRIGIGLMLFDWL